MDLLHVNFGDVNESHLNRLLLAGSAIRPARRYM